MNTPPCSARPACDDYCPAESCVVCGLPEYSEVRKGLTLDPPVVWSCHSNEKIPCTATGLTSFPKNAITISDTREFWRAIGVEFEE